MKKSEFYLVRKILPFLLLCLTLSAFVFHTTGAIAVVNFHADFFEKQEKYRNEIIVLDAGHGGEDGGAMGVNGALEKDINFTITQMVKDRLEEQSIQVILTRDSDTLIGDNTLPSIAERKRSDTKKRLEIVKEYDNCTFVSIHQNHFTQEKYKGAQIFYSRNRTESALLAESIRSEIVENTQPENSRESKAASKNIYILYYSQMPSVLVECGFISNYEEANKLIQTEYQEKIAISITDGIINYLEMKNQSQQNEKSTSSTSIE
ncbi:N-acetylmuramoyl-L-alanine amidase [Scatolibacter rhodanostii]|uniref:N-acetylmuramoyl-L-alanine amidase n=1 Tax=Scatolibacter rhodanostii TaxID=2014781 RepID=UPI001356675D|nr:N-acetylmuramoyl-L-alanine amidase [Scatolibacter rhodanostii]